MSYMKQEILEVLNRFMLAIASITGFVGMNLSQIDLVSGIILKWVSIISFSLLIVINWKKVKTFFKK